MNLENDLGFLPLTGPELHCRRGCASGETDAQIGEKLELTAGEVASVLNVVMLKLRVPNRLAGLAKAGRLGLFENINA